MAVKYVDAVLGLDTNTGDNPGAGATGAWQTINKPATTLAAGDTVHIKASATYTLTASQTFTNSGNGTSGPIIYRGYTTTPGADDGRPVITTATNSTRLFNISGKTGLVFQHLKFTNTASTRAPAIGVPTSEAFDISIISCVFDGLTTAIESEYVTFYEIIGLRVCDCEFLNCSHGIWFRGVMSVHSSYFHDCTGDAIRSTQNSASGSVFGCLIADCDRGLYFGASGRVFIDSCVVYSNTTQGIFKDSGSLLELGLQNCIITGNGGYGVNISAGSVIQALNRNNAYYGNTSGARNNFSAGSGDKTLTGTPYTSPGTGDYSLNNTAGAGADCRNAGFPGVLAFGTGYADIGPLRHQDPAGGSGAVYHGAMAGGLL